MKIEQTNENEICAFPNDKDKSPILPDDTGSENGKPRPDGETMGKQEEEEEEDVD
ncbi:hypothetical protein [Winogradskyella sp.]|jgi:hypothetical protein|uniref:hypothetical protein n=1 Tax=Winogradskyella sp. TaxID=1883156 RepID=UPI0025E8251C|nr:hypothetical protein [Winogradskyella sp.]MCT4628815.1 hypothetical protein [Winogradskyella sp.]